eukprot:13230850-Alexandrium_andersonii.AAC.1
MRQKSGDAWMSGPRPRTTRFASATWPARAPMSSSVAAPSDDAAASPRGAVAGVPPGTPAVGSALRRLTMLFRATPRSWI